MAISMRDVRISNLPPDMLALTERLSIRLRGLLRAVRPKSAAATGARALVLVGNVELRLRAELPPVLAAVPGIQGIVDSVMLSCLRSLEESLTSGILGDYRAWADGVAAGAIPPPGADAATAGAAARREDVVAEQRVYQ